MHDENVTRIPLSELGTIYNRGEKYNGNCPGCSIGFSVGDDVRVNGDFIYHDVSGCPISHGVTPSTLGKGKIIL
jgi:hypothetical protein